MQLIEHTEFGVRSAFLTYEKRGASTRFVLTPMLHLGSPAFYKQVQRTLNECDIVLAEGVPGWRTRVLTLAYRLVGRFRRSELVTQGDGLDMASLKAEVICPDLSEEEFRTGWRGVRWWLRWTLLIAAPFYGLWMAVAGPEAVVSRRLTVDDFPSADEPDDDSGFDELVVDARDRSLCAEIKMLAENPDSTSRAVCVCWGALHMRAVVSTLHDLGYRVADASWVTVM